MSYPLDPSPDQMRKMGDQAVTYLVEFLRSVGEVPANDMEGAVEVALSVRGSPPDVGDMDFDAAMDLVALAASRGSNNAGPGFLAFVPGGGLFTAAVADFLARGLDRFINLWEPSPVFVQIEYNVVRWICDLFGYPPESRGVLTSGGSMANFSAIVAARKALLPEDFLSGTLYVSEQVHASVTKAALLAGFPRRNVRGVACDPKLRMDADALRDAIRTDREASMRPFCVVASVGTTNTGAVDSMVDLAAVCEEEGLWLHADAAYGGFFYLTDRGRALFRGIERADSITVDPHKGMFLPYGTGALVVREGARLRDAHAMRADYLQDLSPEGELPNFSEYSAELSRDIRGLGVWLPLKLHGVGAFREALDEKLDLARTMYEALRETPGFDVPWEPELSIVPFRYLAATGDADGFNRRLLERINASKRVFMSSTLLDGEFWIRPCILNHRTHRDRIDEAIDIIRKAAADLDA